MLLATSKNALVLYLLYLKKYGSWMDLDHFERLVDGCGVIVLPLHSVPGLPQTNSYLERWVSHIHAYA